MWQQLGQLCLRVARVAEGTHCDSVVVQQSSSRAHDQYLQSEQLSECGCQRRTDGWSWIMRPKAQCMQNWLEQAEIGRTCAPWYGAHQGRTSDRAVQRLVDSGSLDVQLLVDCARGVEKKIMSGWTHFVVLQGLRTLASRPQS